MMVTRVAQFAAGLVTTKINALLLGTVGIGIINQLNFLTEKMSQFTTLSMGEAVVKQIAENKVKKNASEIISSALKSYITLVTLFSLITISLLLLFSNALTNYIFGEGDFMAYFYIAVFTFPLHIIGSIPLAILRGVMNIKLISQIRIGIVFTNLLFAVPLIYFFKIEGALFYVPLSYLVDLLLHFIIAERIYFKKLGINLKSINKASFRTDFIHELFYFSGFGITIGTYGIFSELICRSIVVSYLGIDQIGLYSPIIMWASVMTGFLLPALSTYLYPRFCELKSTDEITGLLNDSLRLGSMVIIPLLFIGIPYRDSVIAFFYSDDFISASEYLPFHFFGLLFYVWYYVFTQAMTPTGRIKIHGFFQLLYFSTDILVTYIFVEKYGLYGWMLKHFLSPFVFFFVYFFYANSKMGFKLSKENTFFMIFILFTSLILIYFNTIEHLKWVAYFIGPLMLFSSYFFLTRSEKDFLLYKLKSTIKFIKKLCY